VGCKGVLFCAECEARASEEENQGKEDTKHVSPVFSFGGCACSAGWIFPTENNRQCFVSFWRKDFLSFLLLLLVRAFSASP